MRIKIRKDDLDNWSFVETYNSQYVYNGERTLKTLFSLEVTDTGFSCKPHKFIKGYFKELEFDNNIPDDWLNARKPIYSLLGVGLIVEFKAVYGSEGYLPEKSSYRVYSPYLDRASEKYIPLVPVVTNISDYVDKRIRYFMEYLFDSEYLPSKYDILKKRLEVGRR